MAIDALCSAHLDHFDSALFLLGDIDFIPLIDAITNKDDPNFDDYAWWEAVEAKKKELYPEGIFTKESFEEIERKHDEFVSRKIKEYYDAHPKEREKLSNCLNKS